MGNSNEKHTGGSSPVSSAEGTPGEASVAFWAGGEELDMVIDERGRAAESFITIAGFQVIKKRLFENQIRRNRSWS